MSCIIVAQLLEHSPPQCDHKVVHYRAITHPMGNHSDYALNFGWETNLHCFLRYRLYYWSTRSFAGAQSAVDIFEISGVIIQRSVMHSEFITKNQLTKNRICQILMLSTSWTFKCLRSYRRTPVWLSVWLSVDNTTLLRGFGRQIVSEYRVFRQLLVTSVRRDVGYSYQSQDALSRGNNGQ